MGKKISEETINKIPEAYERLKSKKKVAEELGISSASVSKYLMLFSLPEEAKTEKEKKRKTIVTNELVEKINERYAELKNLSAVSKEFGISINLIKSHLSEENLKINSQNYEDRDALWYYIHRLFGSVDDNTPVSKWNIVQMNKFRSQGMTYRGQLLALKYFYEVKKNSIKNSKNSIGILPFIYNEAEQYYARLSDQQEKIKKEIEEQLKRDRIEIKYKPSDYLTRGRKKNKKKIDISKIGGEQE